MLESMHDVVMSLDIVAPPSWSRSTVKGEDAIVQYSDLSLEATMYSDDGTVTVKWSKSEKV